MTMACALSHFSLPAHHSAASAGARSVGGLGLVRERLNSDKVIADDRGAAIYISRPGADLEWADRAHPPLSGAGLPPSLRRKRPGRILDHRAEREQALLIERAADQLKPERQA